MKIIKNTTSKFRQLARINTYFAIPSKAPPPKNAGTKKIISFILFTGI